MSEFQKYRVKQDQVYQSDFDRLLLETAETDEALRIEIEEDEN